MKTKILAAALTALSWLPGGATLPASGAVITWNAPRDAVAESDVVTNGILLGAFDAGRGGGSVLNGVTFAGDTGANPAQGIFHFGSSCTDFITQDQNWDYHSWAADGLPAGFAPYHWALDGGRLAWWNPGYPQCQTHSATLTIMGLTQGQDYTVQVWFTDNRNGTNYEQQLQGGVPDPVVMWSRSANTHGQYAIGYFTADSSSQPIIFYQPGNQDGPKFSLIQVRRTPFGAGGNVVSNVRASQRPGTKLVDIYYDVTGRTNDFIQVSLAVSTNGGVSYTLPGISCSGSGYGVSVVPGRNRQIVWDAGADWNSNHSANVAFRVAAGNQSVPATLAFIPGGSFQMGDVLNDFPVQWHWGVNPEIPAHSVYISPFSMDQYEVTKALWDEVHDWATNHGYSFEYEDATNSNFDARAPNHPVTGMNWCGAVKWCNARSEMAGLTPAYYTSAAQATVFRTGVLDLENDYVNWDAGYRLPTEAEWEKAARGGSSGHRFSWSDTDLITHSRANYVSNTNSLPYDVSSTPGNHPEGWDYTTNTWPGTTPAGHFAPNGYGLYDMTGNVREWCWNWSPYGFGEAFPYGQTPETNPRGPDYGFSAIYGRAVRGGGWQSDALYCRAAYRFGLQSEYGGYDGGFRCVLPGGQPASVPIKVDTRDLPITVSARVLSPTGSAVVGATVTLAGQTVTTDAQGTFTFANVNLAAGNVLSVASIGFAEKVQTPPIIAGSVGAVLPDLLLRFAAVTNRPVVTDILAQYDGIFLSGVSFPNTYLAAVDWNGFPPNRVEFYVNDTNRPPVGTVATTGTEATINLDMGQGFFGSYRSGANQLVVVAIDGLEQRSDPGFLNVVVIPPPAGLSLTPIDWNLLYGDGPLDPSTLRFRVPVPPAGLLDGFPMAMPLLETLGLHLAGEYKLTYSVPSGAWTLGPDGTFLGSRRMTSPYLDWGWWGPRFWATASASGFASESSGFDLDQVRLQMGLDGRARIFSVHFTDWLPPGPALNQVLDAFAVIGVDVNKAQRIDIYGLFGLQADLTWSCRNNRFNEVTLTPSGGVEATYGIDLYAASLDTYVNGTLAFPIRVTSPQAWKVTGQVSLGLHVYMWHVVNESWDFCLLPLGASEPGEIATSGNWGSQQLLRLPLHAQDGSSVSVEGILLRAESPGPRLMERDYLKHGPSGFMAGNSVPVSQEAETSALALENFRQISRSPVRGSVACSGAATLKRDGPLPEPQFDGPLGETNQVDISLVQNVFPLARPALASRGPELMLLYVADDGSTNRFQFTDIGWTYWDGTNWSAPLAIHTNSQAEFQPQVSYDGNGDALAVWQRVTDPNFTNVNLGELAAQMEIVWSRWSATNGAWSEPLALTANTHLDNAPLLAGPLGNGNVLLTWTENTANLLMGTNGAGEDRVLWCEWNPSTQSWTSPQVLLDGLACRLSQSLAGRGNFAAYAWTLDEDGVLANDADHEVFYRAYTDGSWSEVCQFTTNSVPDKNVRLAVAATGEAHLLWESGTNLVMSRNFTTTNRLARADCASAGFTDYALTLGPADNLVLLWQGMSPHGTDLHYAVQDPTSDSWSHADLLSGDAALERSMATVWDDVGNLTVAYLKQQIIHTNKTVTLTNGSQITFTNVSQRGRSDLLVTKRALVRDLGLDSGDFIVTGANYLPGDPLTLNVIARNHGNVAVSNVVLGFYDGNPEAGGVLLTNVALPGWFEAGATNSATVIWPVPEPATNHVLYAIVNRTGLATEFEESNNAQSVSIGGTDLMPSLVSYRAETNGAVRVYAQVHNLGAPNTVNSVLAIRRVGDTNAPLDTAPVPALEPGQLAQVALNLPPGTQPEGLAAYQLFADDTHANADVNPQNNTVMFAVNLWLDADGDGMPDGWENLYAFLNTTNAADAALDHDGDGLSNLAEYLAGTLPDDPLSYLRLTSIAVDGTSGVQITWGSATNKFYAVQRASALGSAGVFTNLAQHLPATPPENVYLDGSATNSAAFFYRIRGE
jgi:sulfatase modifying factor 1